MVSPEKGAASWVAAAIEQPQGAAVVLVHGSLISKRDADFFIT